MARPSLRRRLLLGLVAYVVMLSAAVTLHGVFVNERAEQVVWQTLLNAELDHLQEQSRVAPLTRWVDTRTMSLYDTRLDATLPAALRDLPPGVHDGVVLDGNEHVVLVRAADAGRLVLALDISELESQETDVALLMTGPALLLVLALVLLTSFGVRGLVRPLLEMARQIGSLRPDRPGQRVELPASATSELEVIAASLNDYLRRNDRFVEREREFVDMASHELRTPVAVIAGATELALHDSTLADPTRVQLQRIRRTTREVDSLISLLLVLAKDPSRLRQTSDRIDLAQLLPEIIADHQHLAAHKDLSIALHAETPCEVEAPLPIVQAAIGNLLRNAIEHSDTGCIHVRLQAPATVVIEDPGHGMSPEQISALYSRLARGGERAGGGIGLDLIARLCEHLGWSLVIRSEPPQGTTTTLRLAASDG